MTGPPVRWQCYELFNAAGIHLKVGKTSRGRQAVHRDAKRCEWWPQVDESRTKLTDAPDEATADERVQYLITAHVPRYNRHHRPKGVQDDGTPDPPRETALDRLARRRAEQDRIRESEPRRRGELRAGDHVYCIPLRADAVVTTVADSSIGPVYALTRADGLDFAPAGPADIIQRRPRPPHYPSQQVLTKRYNEWLSIYWSGYGDPYPPPTAGLRWAKGVAV